MQIYQTINPLKLTNYEKICIVYRLDSLADIMQT